jgi:hypothetical protein
MDRGFGTPEVVVVLVEEIAPSLIAMLIRAKARAFSDSEYRRSCATTCLAA